MGAAEKTYGGYLPIELRHGKEYFDGLPFLRYNCAKAAISAILEKSDIREIYLPLYLCPNVCAEVESHGIPVKYYDITDKLLPEIITDEEHVCFYVVDYFGIMDNSARALVSGIKRSTVILDLCHSFYCEPIMSERVYNIYSAKKFFGVPDGAYLAAKDLPEKQREETFSSDYSSYILKSLEHGTNYCYAEKKEADGYIGRNYGGMSLLARRILENTDYEYVRDKRAYNAKQYDSVFRQMNLFKIETGCSPYAYPLNIGRNIKKQLIDEKIFIPTLWGHLLDKKYIGSREYRFSDETLFLPVDQRYGYEDIDFIISTIKKYL